MLALFLHLVLAFAGVMFFRNPCCCGGLCPCSTPTSIDPAGLGVALDVTLTWTGGPATRTWGNDGTGPLTWSRGETKVMCASYQCTRLNCPTTSIEFEQFSVGYVISGLGGGIRMDASFQYFCGGGPAFKASDRIQFFGVTTDANEAILQIKDSYYLTFTSHFGYSNRTNIAADNFGTYATNFVVDTDGFIEAGHFGGGVTGSVTDTNAQPVTYTWTLNPDCSQPPLC